MTDENALKLLIAGASLTGGAFLTAVRQRLSASKKKDWLHWIFHFVSGVVILGTIFYAVHSFNRSGSPDWFAIIIMILSVVFSVALSFATHKWLAGKRQFSTDELDPIVNKFSSDSDSDNIRLIAGNLDFFESKGKMELHPQYARLRELQFQSIDILCKHPISAEDERRYGKILIDFPRARFRFYNPEFADVKIRGRITTLSGVPKLLIYNKIAAGRYQLLELNTAENDGALYSRLWELLWNTAKEPTPAAIAAFKASV